ncbi:CehA/McbA family metallohydrolase [Glaciecola sp. XM2]|uniref:CehA/McbA family metallohydrolase n=1 Tax=Glaciecola sp. XM2 TaxID=1914931 RepID=UPI00203306C8|nr:CehA/McbA family metallohydrolase [Glaciecola sp. XM2]
MYRSLFLLLTKRSYNLRLRSPAKLPMRGFSLSVFCLSFACIFALSTPAYAQWVNQYPKLDDFGHQIYLEQHELPIHAYGITDPAPSPDGKRIAISSKGWIWLVDIDTGVANRLTSGSAQDSRPRWSRDGQQLAFVRDFGDDTAVVLKHLSSGSEMVINSPAIDLDPEFSHDGSVLYYTSGKSGSLELYQRNIADGNEQQITRLPQVVRNARRVANGKGVVYLHGNREHRVLRHRDFISGEDKIINAQTLTYHFTSDMHPSLDLLVYSAPIDNDYHLYTMNLSDLGVKKRLTYHTNYAMTPAFSADGNSIYFVDIGENRQFELKHIATVGGEISTVNITRWDYGVATGQMRLSVSNNEGLPSTARVSIVSADGHPVTNPAGASFFDAQTARSYFYADKTITLNLPVGDYALLATQGPMAEVFSANVTVKSGETAYVDITNDLVFNSQRYGYQSADFHVHLNGDGHQRANHDDALVQMRGEDLNYLVPMSWNRWERLIDSDIVGKHTQHDAQHVVQGQEVRSHFHGHIGLLNVTEPHHPWFFGHLFPILGDPNVSNAGVFAYANKVGAFATYVHPVGDDGDPFADENLTSIPLELVSDGVLEAKMGLEIVCAWTSPIANAQLWYRLLNIGRPVSAMSGTDTWIDFHRVPTVGTGRAYVRPLETPDMKDSVLAGAIAGRSFVTTGPSLLFSVGNAKPGDTIDAGKQTFSLDISSTVDLDVVEIIVNGEVVETFSGVAAGKTTNFSGSLTLPEGGWIAARTMTSELKQDSWPTMHARPFAHSSPIWINEIGSIEQTARKAAAQDLIRAINASQQRAKDAYKEQDMPKLYERFEQARQRLQGML